MAKKSKSNKVEARELKQGAFFRRGRKKAVWQKDDNSTSHIVSAQLVIGKQAGSINTFNTDELVTPVEVLYEVL